MDTGYLLLLALVFGFLFILYQRTEARKRRITLLLNLLVLVVVGVNSVARERIGEMAGGLLLALFVSWLFWLVIGRYNPVGSSDEIQVIGMDD